MIGEIRNLKREAEAAEEALDELERGGSGGGFFGGGGSGGGGGGGRGRQSRTGNFDRFGRTQETVDSTRAINDLEKFVNEQVARTRKNASRAIEAQNRQIRDAVAFRKTQRRREAAEEKYHRDLRIRSQANAEKALQREVNTTRQAARKALRQQEQETRRIENQINTARRTIEVGLLELFFTLHSFLHPITEITRLFERMTIGIIRASTEMEKYASTLVVATGDISSANRVLASLLKITVDLAAIDTASLIQYASRLQTAGLNARETESALIGVTKRMEEQGKSAEQTGRVLEQIVQVVNSNIVSMQDFRPILREFPTLYDDLSQALGRTVTDLDTLRDAADEVGGATETMVLLFEHLRFSAVGANVNTINKQLDEFRDRVFNLQAALGDGLRPVVLTVLKAGNRVLEFLSGMNETLRILLASVLATATGIGKLVSGLGQLSIIAIVYFQMRSASQQILAASASLEALSAVTGRVNPQLNEMRKQALRVGGTMTILQRALPLIVSGFGALLVILPSLAVAYHLITRRSRELREEQETFVSVLGNLPNAYRSGNEALREQLNSLRTYRAEISGTIDDLREAARRAEEVQRRQFGHGPVLNTREQNRRLLEQNIADEVDVQALRQAEQHLESIENIIKNTNLAFDEQSGTLESINAQLRVYRGLAQAARLVDDTESLNNYRKAIFALEAVFNRLASIQPNVEAIQDFDRNLILLDANARRLRDTIGDIDAENLVDAFGRFDLSNVNKLYNDLLNNLVKNAENRRGIARQNAAAEGRTEQELSNDILDINVDLDYKIRSLLAERAKFVDEVESESADKRVGRITKYLAFEQAAADARRQAEEKLYEANLNLTNAQTENLVKGYDRRVEADIRLRKEQLQTLRLGIENVLLLDDRVQEYYRKSTTNAVIYADIVSGVRSRIRETGEVVKELTNNLTDSITKMEAFRRESDETETFRFREPTRPATQEPIPSGVQIPRVPRVTPLDPEDLTGQFGRVLELQEAITNASRDIIRENNRIIHSFSRGVSRSLTDLIFDGEETFTEFFLQFAKTTARIIIQARLDAEIRKRISDDLTQHEIRNIKKVADAKILQGATLASLSTAELSALSPVASFATSGISNIALIGLAIAPFLVRAIKDGFGDTKVEMDGREVGRVTHKNIKKLARSRTIRL